MKIGDVSKLTGVPRGTIRYYEELKLIESPGRTDAGYRNYSRKVIKELRFIKRAQELGFSLREITELMALQNNIRNATCRDVKQYAIDKVEMIEKKIADLKQIRSRLLELIASCEDENSLEVCPILDAFEVGSDYED